MSSIIDNFLYLGSISDACTPAVLIKLEITHLLNLSLTRVIFDESIEILHLPLRDTLDENIINHFEQTNAFIERCRQLENGRCLVVCKHGRSRSPTVVLAYLISHHNHSLSSAYIFVSNCRPSISPNRNYLHQLDQYSSQCEQNRVRLVY